ncbi:hypothetical protein KOEU_34260 [Komagataeibacter europaeus]|uniref:Uncharacterized protein n=1 Tax=Komagataeibacter europaeus TaxID=33995 RepID=A0A0M0ECK9_KOMEU|nr:hypothetical protein KOEU_35550 [Komagataeibacter europaeus]KON63066.1 hypothetical protein KOEU_34260 [Komagataeibacter europaeus]
MAWAIGKVCRPTPERRSSVHIGDELCLSCFSIDLYTGS